METKSLRWRLINSIPDPWKVYKLKNVEVVNKPYNIDLYLYDLYLYFFYFSTNTPGPFLGILISFSQRERETVKERERERKERERELIFPSKLNFFTQYSRCN